MVKLARAKLQVNKSLFFSIRFNVASGLISGFAERGWPVVMLVRLCKNDQLRAETRKMHFGPGGTFRNG